MAKVDLHRHLKIVLAPDSFKGSLTALQVCHAMADGVRRADPLAEIVLAPMADGGEGTVDALLTSSGGIRVHRRVAGPLGDDVTASYAIFDRDRTAVIEMAAASGLPLVPIADRNPFKTTSLGAGQLIADALDRGCHRLIIGLGGSATCDGGSGMAQALGVRFLGIDPAEVMNGERMGRVTGVDLSGLHPHLAHAEIVAACDVDNPLLGPAGAVMVYGPQKGATAEQLPVLEHHMAHFAAMLEKAAGRAVSGRAGAGAAGGLGAALMALAAARIERGIDVVMQACQFEDKIRDADLILTGEGRLDAQTRRGKTVWGVAQAAKKFHVPVIAIVGCSQDRQARPGRYGLTAIQPLYKDTVTLEEAIHRAAPLVADAAERIMLSWRT